MHDIAADQTRPQRRFAMFPKLDFIRRVADHASQVARLVAFNIEVDIDVTEEDIVQDLEVRGYGLHAGA